MEGNILKGLQPNKQLFFSLKLLPHFYFFTISSTNDKPGNNGHGKVNAEPKEST